MTDSQFNDMNAHSLITYILENHHTYVKSSIPMLEQFSKKVVSYHGGEYDELVKIAALLKGLFVELLSHIEKEENILFPNILDLQKIGKDDKEINPKSESNQNLIIAMIYEHENALKVLGSIKNISNDYAPWGNACKTTIAYFAKLKEFHEDLLQHIHLENDILFPKVEELIKELTGKDKDSESNELRGELSDLDDELF